MMSSSNQQQLLDIQPKELRFVFELKKQSSCAVRLTNKTYHNVAFKVKTTSPKKYCVRPNVGVISPKSTCEFTVTMQAPKIVPLEMTCKDKFLIQSTVVPLGTTDNEMAPNTFIKEDGKHIEEIKLKVALVSPSESPVLSPINGVLNHGPFFEPSVLRDPAFENSALPHAVIKNVESKMANEQERKANKIEEVKAKKDMVDTEESNPVKDVKYVPTNDVINGEELNMTDGEGLTPEKDAASDKPAKDAEFSPPTDSVKDVFSGKLAEEVDFPPPMNSVNGSFSNKLAKEVAFSAPMNAARNTNSDELLKDAESPLTKSTVKDVFNDKLEEPAPQNEEHEAEFVVVKAVNELKLVSDIEEMKYKLNGLESKLNEAESTISKLMEQRRLSTQERKRLQEELVMLGSRTSGKHKQVGFPLLFVVMVALVSIFVGYISHR